MKVNTEFSQEQIHIADKYFQKVQHPQLSGKCKIKTALVFYLIQVRMAIKKQNKTNPQQQMTTNAGKDVDKGQFTYTVVQVHSDATTMEIGVAVPQKS